MVPPARDRSYKPHTTFNFVYAWPKVELVPKFSSTKQFKLKHLLLQEANLKSNLLLPLSVVVLR
jgi:hypothetical protein